MKNEFYIDDINKTVNFTFPFNEEIKNKLKNCDYNSRFNDESKEWIVPITEYTKPIILQIVKEYSFIKKVLKIEEDFVYVKPDYDYSYLKGLCDSKGFMYEPREYQLEALGYALEKGSFINADSVGLGKSFESIMYADVTNSFPCLTITPASIKHDWGFKWKEICKGRYSVSVIESNSKKNDWNADVVVINYDILGKKQGTGATVRFKELMETDWKSIIIDEAHFLKQSKSIRSRAAKMILKNRDCKVQMLTGTAIMSRPIELWNLLVLLGKEKLIATDWMGFARRYCGAYKGKFGFVTDGATNVMELNDKLRKNLYIRREKEDVLKELPSVIKQVIQLPITNKAKINKATKNFIEYIKESKGNEAADKAMEAQHLVAISELRKLSIEGKFKAIDQYLKDWKTNSEEKLLIFGIHREFLEKLSRKYGSMLISGGVSSKKKQEIVSSWISNDEQFLFANMQSAGTGIDGFQKVCSNMIIVELPWKPSEIEQTIGRIHRSGQSNTPYVNFMLSDETIDKDMFSMLESKERITSAVNRGIDIKRAGSSLGQVIKSILKK